MNVYMSPYIDIKKNKAKKFFWPPPHPKKKPSKCKARERTETLIVWDVNSKFIFISKFWDSEVKSLCFW